MAIYYSLKTALISELIQAASLAKNVHGNVLHLSENKYFSEIVLSND